MKNFFLLMGAVSFFISCNNADKKSVGGGLKAKADSLYQEVLHGHDEGMVGWMKIEDKKKAIQHLQDSVNTLAGKASTDFKERLSGAMNDLQTAYNDMDSWMRDMNLDSATDNLEQRIKYLTEEKLKAATIKAAINNSIQKADSLLRSKF